MPTIHSQYSESSGSGIFVKFPSLAGFTILEHLHEGAYASIYRARQDRLGRIVALKLLQEWPPPTDVALERFNRAAYVGAQSLHSNLITVHDTGTRDGYHFALMEHVEGLTLQKLLAQMGRLNEAQAVNIGLQVAQALAAMHGRNICHRNVKPKNIFYENNGRIRLIGLGLASCKSAFFSPHLDAHAIGTPHFMAPEMIKGSCSDPRSDLYSLGVTLYVMTVGHPPFERGIPAVVMSRHLTDSPVPLSSARPDLSPQFVKLVHALMARKPDQRIQTAAEAIRAFEKLPSRRGPSSIVLPRNKDSKKPLKESLRGLVRKPLAVALLAMAVTLGVVHGIMKSAAWIYQRPAPASEQAQPRVIFDQIPGAASNSKFEPAAYKVFMDLDEMYQQNPFEGVEAANKYLRRYPDAPASRREQIQRIRENYLQKLRNSGKKTPAQTVEQMEF